MLRRPVVGSAGTASAGPRSGLFPADPGFPGLRARVPPRGFPTGLGLPRPAWTCNGAGKAAPRSRRSSAVHAQGRRRPFLSCVSGAAGLAARANCCEHRQIQSAGERMALLELRLFDALQEYDSHTPALDSLLSRNPRLYAELVDCASRIDEAGQDCEAVALGDWPARINSRIARLVLRKKRFLPGASANEPVDAERVLAWIRQARDLCEVRGMREEGDCWVGRLLATAGIGADGVWPCEGARDALEQISNDAVNAGFQSGIFGSGGSRISGFRGAEEKRQANKHANWSGALQYSNPRVSSLLDHVAGEYRRMSAAWSQNENLRNQLRNST